MAISKVVSIEITDVVTRVCEIGYNKKNPTIYKSLIFQNPERTVDDGFIMERGEYGAALKKNLQDAGIKTKDVVFSIASNKIVSREVNIPEMKEELIPGLIDSERGEYFPMDTTGHFMTYLLLDHIKETKQMRIIVFAAPEILVKNYQALAAELDLKIAALDYNGNSLYQYLHRNTAQPMEMYLQINEKNSMFTILEKNIFALQRNMNFGTNVMAQNLVDEGFYGDIDEDMALDKLREEALLYESFTAIVDTVPEDEEQAKLHELKKRMTDSVRPLIGNISRVLEYYNTRNRDAKISKIYIGGIGAGILGLKELIESEFNGLEIEVVDTLPGLTIHKDNATGRKRSTEFIACIGAAHTTINFYQVDAKDEKSKTLTFCVIALILVIAASVAIVFNGYFQYTEQRDKHDKLAKKLADLEAVNIEQLENDFYASAGKVESVAVMDASTFNFNEYWNDIISYLESESVKNMSIGSISSSNQGLTMNVTVSSKEEAAKVLLQFQKIPYFEDVQINGISETIDEETMIKTVTFSLNCTYKIPDPGTITE